MDQLRALTALAKEPSLVLAPAFELKEDLRSCVRTNTDTHIGTEF